MEELEPIKGRVLIVGDVHGNIKALREVLKKCEFDNETDTLIFLGDLVDSFTYKKGIIDVKATINFILSINNKIILLGNHDYWFSQWLINGENMKDYYAWYTQGGRETLWSYQAKSVADIPSNHISLFFFGIQFYHILNDVLFIHAGFREDIGFKKISFDDVISGNVMEDYQDYFWDRTLYQNAKKHPIDGFKHIFIGHTTTELEGSDKPLTFHNLTMMDTGAGYTGKLTIMDLETRKYWQSGSD